MQDNKGNTVETENNDIENYMSIFKIYSFILCDF